MATAKGRGKGQLTARQQKSIELAKKYQKEAAILKRKGLLTNRVNARKKITHATRTKINKFREVLEGTAIAVPAPRSIRATYEASETLPTVGRFILAPREYEHQRARLKRGMVMVSRPLKNGTEEYIILPFKPTDLPDLARRLQSDPTLDGLKMADEFFSFRLHGHNSNDSFVDAAEMGRSLEHYIARLGGNKNIVKHITFQRFKTSSSHYNDDGMEFMRNPHVGKEPIIPYNSNVDGRGRSRTFGTYEINRNKRRAFKQAQKRENETPEQKAARLAYARKYSARYRQRKFEEK